MRIEVRFGILKNQRDTVAKIFYDAFGPKFGIIFSDKLKMMALISACLDDAKTIIALKDGSVVGFSGLQYSGKSFLDPNLRQVVEVFGLASFRVVLVGSLFIFLRAGDSNELLLESLAVSVNERNKGIGQKLLQFTIEYARSKKFSQLKLEVIDTNPKARRLYERLGFVESKVQRLHTPSAESWVLEA